MWNARLSCLGGWIIPLALNLNESSPEDGLIRPGRGQLGMPPGRQTAHTKLGCAQQTFLLTTEVPETQGKNIPLEQKSLAMTFLVLHRGIATEWQPRGPGQKDGSSHFGAAAPVGSRVRRLYLKPLHVHDSFQ